MKKYYVTRRDSYWRCSRLLYVLLLCCFLNAPSMAVAQAGGDVPPAKPIAAPQAIYVADFLLDAEAKEEPASRQGPLQVRKKLRDTVNEVGPRQQENPKEKAAMIVDVLAQSIVAELKEKNVNALRATAQTRSPAESWLLQGEFVEYDEGSRMKKAVIGFGSGSSTMQIHITLTAVSGGSSSTLLDTAMDGKKNRMPGAVVTKNPYAAAAKFVMAKNAPERDVKKLGSQIADTILGFMKDQGLVKP
jgi:hypothetical protein